MGKGGKDVVTGGIECECRKHKNFIGWKLAFYARQSLSLLLVFLKQARSKLSEASSKIMLHIFRNDFTFLIQL